MKVELQNLTKVFPSRNKKENSEVIAVNNFTFEIPDGKLVGLLIVLQIFALITSRSRSAIHDLISDAVVVDLASQQVFDTLDDLMAYKNKIHEEMVSKSDY